MRWWGLRNLVAAVAAGVLAFAGINAVQADHNVPPVLPNALTFYNIQYILNNGESTYCLDDRSRNYPNFISNVQQVAEAGLSETRIPAREAPCNQASVLVYAPADAEFLRLCGQGAAGCIYSYSNGPARVYWRLALNYFDNRSLCAHEGCAGNTGHAVGQHEMYDDINFKCLTDRTWTIMSCGAYVAELKANQWIPQFPFDVFTVWNLLIPDQPSYVDMVNNDRWLWIRVNGFREDGGKAHHGSNLLDNVKRVAVFRRFPGGDWEWTGYYITPASTNGLSSRGFALRDWCADGVTWGVRPENNLAATYLGGIKYISGDVKFAGVCPNGYGAFEAR